MTLSRQRQGELFIFAESVLWAFFPIITILSYNTLSPLVSLIMSNLFALCFFVILMTKKKLWHEIKNRATYKNLLFTSLLIGVGFYLLVFIALQSTTPGNASILSLTQIFFNFLFFHVFRREHIPTAHIWGAFLMVFGAVIILIPNFHTFNLGDILIILAILLCPFGNFYAQKARKQISSETLMFFRTSISTVFILLFALAIQIPFSFPAIQQSLPFLLINGLLLMGISKIFWIEGIHRISVTKASSLDASISPLMTLFFAWLILQQQPTLWQLTAILPTVLGVYLLSKSSNQPQVTPVED